MFGLKSGSNKTHDEFQFDLEKDLKDQKKRNELKMKIEGKVQEIKQTLRDGENKKDFEKLAIIMHGYNAMLKVFARFEPARK